VKKAMRAMDPALYIDTGYPARGFLSAQKPGKTNATMQEKKEPMQQRREKKEPMQQRREKKEPMQQCKKNMVCCSLP
jgi:hypothetical protein